MRKLIAILLILSVILTGCGEEQAEEQQSKVEITKNQDQLDTQRPVAEIAIERCIELCLRQDGNLDQGPCLSNEIVEDWVCDVAHAPRLTLDNQPENQCFAYREGKAQHFVEIDPDCNFIRFN